MARLIRKKVCYAFIDSQNLHLSIKNLGWKLDFLKLYKYLQNTYKVSKAFIFIGQVSGQDDLYNHLKKMGYTLVFKPTVSYMQNAQEKTKGNVDAELVLRTMIEIKNYDRAIIISGDGDFHGLVDYLHKQHKLYKIGIPNRYDFSALLREFSFYHFYISGLRSKLEYRTSKDFARKKLINSRKKFVPFKKNNLLKTKYGK